MPPTLSRRDWRSPTVCLEGVEGQGCWPCASQHFWFESVLGVFLRSKELSYLWLTPVIFLILAIPHIHRGVSHWHGTPGIVLEEVQWPSCCCCCYWWCDALCCGCREFISVVGNGKTEILNPYYIIELLCFFYRLWRKCSVESWAWVHWEVWPISHTWTSYRTSWHVMTHCFFTSFPQ